MPDVLGDPVSKMPEDKYQTIRDSLPLLCNAVGKLDGQRLSERWFTKRGLAELWNTFKEEGCTNAENLWKYLNDDDGMCKCGNSKRFVGFRDGFKAHCEKCARTEHNHMKSAGDVVVPLDDIHDYVLTASGKISTSKLKKLSKETIAELERETSFLGDVSLSERLWNHIHNPSRDKHKCPVCEAKMTFSTFETGYRSACSMTCSSVIHKDKRLVSLRKSFYEKTVAKHKSVQGSSVDTFTEEEYIDVGSSAESKFTCNNCEHEYYHKNSYQGSLHCPKCYPIRSRSQYEVYEFIRQYSPALMNDRKLLGGKELDILVPGKFAIEYDSLAFHSYGRHKLTALNRIVPDQNCHLEKTLMCEERGIQLYRIFSNEFKNPEKWHSVLKSALGVTERIYARKCVVSTITNKDAKEFCENNHLQGHVNSSVNVGLFYDGALMSVMTFGKSRYAKDMEWELLRFCSKLGYTVVGGASKLLKFFEVNHKPKSLISYANRRWSQGNLYEKLGFEFSHSTKPNYWYIPPVSQIDHSILLSRVQFQKHKLKDKLENFNPDLSETENMFANGYRKIYDCGNLVFTKTYK